MQTNIFEETPAIIKKSKRKERRKFERKESELQIISLGLGVQSTALYLMSSLGELPRADYAIFADTGAEKPATLKYLKWLQKWAKENNGIPIIVVRRKSIYKDILYGEGRFAGMPLFTKNPDGTIGMLRRQCTGEYKIIEVDQEIRALYSLSKGAKNHPTTVWKGITLDEIERATIPLHTEKWKTFYYPFLNLLTFYNSSEFVEGLINTMSRASVIKWFSDRNLPCPPKSSCFICPYMSDSSWLDIKMNDPKTWIKAVRVDRKVRNSTSRGIHQPAYLHRSCVPLDEVVFDQTSAMEWGECSGNCHV